MKYIQYSILLFMVYGCKPNNNATEPEKYLDHVGDLTHDPELDSKDFHSCHEDLVNQYYAFGQNIQYKGEKRALMNSVYSQYNGKAFNDTGYITIRFIVNCEGQSGRFRVKTLDNAYNPVELNTEMTAQLLSIVKGLDGWIPGMYEGKGYDYYQYLTFKIESGEITSILP